MSIDIATLLNILKGYTFFFKPNRPCQYNLGTIFLSKAIAKSIVYPDIRRDKPKGKNIIKRARRISLISIGAVRIQEKYGKLKWLKPGTSYTLISRRSFDKNERNFQTTPTLRGGFKTGNIYIVRGPQPEAIKF